MKLVDIQNAITKRLHESFPNNKILIEQQKEIIKPTFLVSLSKLNTNVNTTYRNKKALITINYANKEYSKVENNNIADSLEECFEVGLKVLDRYLVIENIDFNDNGDCLCMQFTVEYNDIIEKLNIPKMEELKGAIK